MLSLKVLLGDVVGLHGEEAVEQFLGHVFLLKSKLLFQEVVHRTSEFDRSI